MDERSSVQLVERAPAKINLTLRIRSRRPDGYHELESLVAFADIADELEFRPNEELGLTIAGPFGSGLSAGADNLVLRAVSALAEQSPELKAGQFHLVKNLPAAAGIGGGSSDAAAALRLLARANAIPAGDPRLFEAAAKVGADVPVCVGVCPRMMSGIGEVLSPPVDLPWFPAVLLNPRVETPTAAVFKALGLAPGASCQAPLEAAAGHWVAGASTKAQWLAAIKRSGNDLEAPAISLHPAIADALKALASAPGAQLARMSGSGATCFALFERDDEARAAASALQAAHPHWWIVATTIGTPAH